MQIPYSPSRLDTTMFLKNNIRKYLRPDQSIIDIGCGAMYLSNLLDSLKLKINYLGVDLNPKNTKFRSVYLKTKIVKGDILNFKAKRKFDLVACLWTLEHIKHDQGACKKMFGLLNKEGFTIIAVPSIWSWPIELGRHGYRYYSKTQIIKLVKSAGFGVAEFYESGGFLGLLFMLIYSWPRYLVLVPLLIIYTILNFLNLVRVSWEKFSHKVVSNVFYFYHKSQEGILFHNMIVSKIVALDNKFKIFPASYVLILKK